MPIRAIILADTALPPELISDWKQVCNDFASFIGEDVEFMLGDQAAISMLSSSLASQATTWRLQSLEAGAGPPPPMTSADFIFREDGRPDWAAMWTSFCELALYGGPPHRGEDSALTAPVEVPQRAEGETDALHEIRRGIFETTGLFAEPAEPGWMAVTCTDRKMAAWLCATIILENVDARFEDERLFVPASPAFKLKDEVKSVVTVLAKCHHYWEAHIAGQEAVG